MRAYVFSLLFPLVVAFSIPTSAGAQTDAECVAVYDANGTRSMIGVPGGKANYFHNIPGICINVASAVTEPGIFNNWMAVIDDTQGHGITLAAAVSGAWVMGNTANFGDADMVANPFEDGAAGDANTWANNYKGITLIHPV